MEYDLVFEGGGAKGMVFVGAMQEFEQRGHSYKRLLGTSAGAITAALLAAGYSAQEMLEALGEKENGRSVFSSFLGQPGPFEKAQVLKSATLQFLQGVDIPLLPNFLDQKLDEVIVRWLAGGPKTGLFVLVPGIWGAVFGERVCGVVEAAAGQRGAPGQAAPLQRDDAGGVFRGNGDGADPGRVGYERGGDAGAEPPHGAAAAAGVGGAHVDEHSAAVAGGDLASGMGRLPGPGDGWAHHRGWGHALQFPHRAVRLAG